MRCTALFLLPALFGSSAALADSQRDCAVHADSSARIAACSELIRKNPRDAGAHLNRGSAFRAKGELDRALADYDKALELRPNYAAAYESRGAAYAAKGDYVHAVADVTRAGELSKIPRATPASAKAAPAASANVTPASAKPPPLPQQTAGVSKPKPPAKPHAQTVPAGATAETFSISVSNPSVQ